MSDPITIAIDQVKAGESPAEPGEVQVDLNGQSFSLTGAIEELRKIVTNNVEPFDSSKPRLIEPVEIEIGGKVRHLTLPFWALRRFQKTTGTSPWDHEKVWAIPADLDLTVALLWVALLEESPDLTMDEVWMFKGLDFANIHYVRRCLDDCWGRNMPGPEKANGNSGEGGGPNSRRRSQTG